MNDRTIDYNLMRINLVHVKIVKGRTRAHGLRDNSEEHCDVPPNFNQILLRVNHCAKDKINRQT